MVVLHSTPIEASSYRLSLSPDLGKVEYLFTAHTQLQYTTDKTTVSNSDQIFTQQQIKMGKKRAREADGQSEVAGASEDKMDQDGSSDDEVNPTKAHKTPRRNPTTPCH